MILELASCKHVRSIVVTNAPARIVQVAFSYTCDNENKRDAAVSLQVNNTCAQLLCDEVHPHPLYAELLCRTMVFSCRISRTCGDAIMCFTCKDEPMHNVQHTISASELAALDDAYVRQTLPCELDGAYESWLFHRGSSLFECATQARAEAGFSYKPLISLIIPFFNTPILYVYELVDSLRAQSYTRFEVICAIASPNQTELVQTLECISALDSRFIVVKLQRNAGIARNSYEAAAHAHGDYLAFVDHDDTLDPACLFWYVDALQPAGGGSASRLDTRPDMLYCDEDKINEDGHYCFAFCKPDWSPQLALSYNYVCHMLMLTPASYRSIMDTYSASGLDIDGVQDWACVLAAAELGLSIHHVPKILYHWRMSAQSTAASDNQKAALTEKSAALLERHFDRVGLLYELLYSTETQRRFSTRLLPTYRPYVRYVCIGAAAQDPARTRRVAACLGYEYECIWIEPCKDTAVCDDTYDDACDAGGKDAAAVVWRVTFDKTDGEVHDSDSHNSDVRDSTTHTFASLLEAVAYVLCMDAPGFVALACAPICDVTHDMLARLLAHAAHPSCGVAGTKDVLRDGTKIGGALYINAEGMHTIDAWYSADNQHIRGYEAIAHEVDVVNSHLLVCASDHAQTIASRVTEKSALALLTCDLQPRALPCELSALARSCGFYVVEACDVPFVVPAQPCDIFNDTGRDLETARTIDSAFRAVHPSLFVPPHPYYSVLLDGDGSYRLGH